MPFPRSFRSCKNWEPHGVLQHRPYRPHTFDRGLIRLSHPVIRIRALELRFHFQK
jgi:hypothetical protein